MGALLKWNGWDYERNYDNLKEQMGANLNSPVSKMM